MSRLDEQDLHAKLAGILFNVSQQQITDARDLIAKMSDLGVERDVPGALVERHVITEAQADQIRRTAREAATNAVQPKAAVAAPPRQAPSDDDDEPVEMASADDEIRLAAAPGPEDAAAAEGRTVCSVHPGATVVGRCNHCKRPLCKDCVVRSEKGIYCSEECMAGARIAKDAVSAFRNEQFQKAVALGRRLSWVGAIIVLIVLAIVAKYVIDDYRFTFAMQRASRQQQPVVVRLEEYRRAVALRPENVSARLGLGRTLLNNGELGSAIEELSLALKLDPNNVDVVRELAVAHRGKGNYAEAKKAYLLLGTMGGADSASELALGLICQEHLNQLEDAIQAYRRSMELGSESRELHYRIGRALTDLGRLQLARQELEKAVAPLVGGTMGESGRERVFLADRDKMAAIHEALAALATKEGDDEAALRAIVAAHELSPGRYDLAKKHAQLLDATGKADEVLAMMARHWSHLNGVPEYLAAMAELYEENDDTEKHLNALRRLHQLTPNEAGVVEKLIKGEATYGERQRALDLLNTLGSARAHAPEFAEAWSEIITYQLSYGNAAEAERALKDLGPLANKDPRFAALWCETLHSLGRDQEALQRAEIAVKEDPDAPTPHLIIGSVLSSVGRTREAFVHIYRAKELGVGGQASYQAGVLSWEAGLNEEGKRHFIEALEDVNLPEKIRSKIRLNLDRQDGRMFEPVCRSRVEDHILSCLDGVRPSSGDSLWQIHLASYGIARSFSVLCGTSSLDATGNEIERLQSVTYSTENMLDPDVFVQIRPEYDRAVKSLADFLRNALPASAGADIDTALRNYGKSSYGSVGSAAPLAAGARAQVDLMSVWLQRHPKNDQLAVQIDTIVKRMESRMLMAPGDLQAAVASDIALAEMVHLAIVSGREAPAYAAAAGAAMSTLVSRVSGAGDSMAQLCASRIGVFEIVRVLMHQLLETGKSLPHGEPRPDAASLRSSRGEV